MVNGAICMASPNHCAVRPLYIYWSVSHVPNGSHATSTMIPGVAELSMVLLAPVKKTDSDERRFSVRVFHVAFVFVWVLDVSVSRRKAERYERTKLVMTALPYMNAPAAYVNCRRSITLQFSSVNEPSKTWKSASMKPTELAHS